MAVTQYQANRSGMAASAAKTGVAGWRRRRRRCVSRNANITWHPALSVINAALGGAQQTASCIAGARQAAASSS